ncbi:hypothetical protein [Streptomyces sp. MZ04]|uniref:hypothetical protein n=1 Tax=Streptomyces sp. MZ04 TaxID=2559236 RepID=UPI00107EA27C|nr:hypothetical protein [Streptomyces sp. MZ04]TGB13754.1 hypothetical protein E2651_08065 [Streptomyces sp. MZ04]
MTNEQERESLVLVKMDAPPETVRTPSPCYTVMYGQNNQEAYRVITVSSDEAHTDKLVIPDKPWSQSPGLKGVTTPLLAMPVPGRESVDGKSEHYLICYNTTKKELTYRTIATLHKDPYTISLMVDDRSVSAYWNSMANIKYPVASMPVPRRHNVEGKSEHYVYHYDEQGKLYYSTISISRDATHADRLVVERRPVADWWKASLTGIGQLAEIFPVPGQQDVDGKSQYYVFHRLNATKKLMYRKIAITCDPQHTDTLVTEDRPVADYWSNSLKGVE